MQNPDNKPFRFRGLSEDRNRPFENQRNDSNNGSSASVPEILFITSFPPRECGIATYSQDLVAALQNTFDHSFQVRICPVESKTEQHSYAGEVEYFLNTDEPNSFQYLASQINEDARIEIVVVQHEFGFFRNRKMEFLLFLQSISKPVILEFHTVLPEPDAELREMVIAISKTAMAIIVMTHSSEKILISDYGISAEKLSVIPHGTHLVPHSDKAVLKRKYKLTGRTVLSTFGLLGPGKSIETTLLALPEIVKLHPDVLFLVIGKTHPSIVKNEGEEYRRMLESFVAELHLEHHVAFINQFLPLPDLLEYLQLTDIYLFTSKDPKQAVSGTFAYAISCGCPIVSTPIPHAREVLKDYAGIIVNFGDSPELANAVLKLLEDSDLRKNISSNGLHRMASTSWENAAIAHGLLFSKVSEAISLTYRLPGINLSHMKKLTTSFGMIQFSVINQPALESGFTLDDNARAMVAFCQNYELFKDPSDLRYMAIYLRFIVFCQQSEGNFLNYVDATRQFTHQNVQTNLSDSNGRAIWALGYIISKAGILPSEMIAMAEHSLNLALPSIRTMHSTRAMSFAIKGLYYRNLNSTTQSSIGLTTEMADRLVQMYRHESDPEWQWFESYLTYANSILPEAMLCAFLVTGNPVYREIALESFQFLLDKIFPTNRIQVISNKEWLKKGEVNGQAGPGGEQPIDVAYTIMALSKFYLHFKDEDYRTKMRHAFDWFLGSNHLHQIIYNPCTGGCYDGLEEENVNLNQGAESTVSYLMARLTMEKALNQPISVESLSRFGVAPAHHPDRVSYRKSQMKKEAMVNFSR